MNLDILINFAGLVAAVSLIVQFTKSMVKRKFGDSMVRIYALVISLILTFIFARSGGSIEGITLTIINSILITITSMGAYEMIVDPKAEKSK
ncbi:hypothetical protein CIW83_20640 [Tissierella sp. P1]|uniref:Holin n=1 Tax=Tissierella carlieri TaxID=689904 RepID=A0ABT1SEA3_9FIRM|nr:MULTISPECIES: hypothetical protein [Tissierella]MCQ4924790.1 hypothetical protein [Tissierella carlieri]OZV10364.1 hypothetical protein CIW83_20640 [Tissierella sp. P1]